MLFSRRSDAGSEGSLGGQDSQNSHQVTSALPTTMGDYIVPHTQLELGHSLVRVHRCNLYMG